MARTHRRSWKRAARNSRILSPSSARRCGLARRTAEPAQPARSSPLRARAAAQGQTGQALPHGRPRHLAAAVWAQGSPGAPWHAPPALHVHGTCTCSAPASTAPAPRMHVARSHSCRTSAAALPLALHSSSVAGQGDPAGGPVAAARCQVRARVATQHGHTRLPGSGRANHLWLEAPSR